MSIEEKNEQRAKTVDEDKKIDEAGRKAVKDYSSRLAGSVVGSIVSAVTSVATLLSAKNAVAQAEVFGKFAKTNPTAIFAGGAVITVVSLVLTAIFASAAIGCSADLKKAAKQAGMTPKQYKKKITEQSD